MRDGDRPPPAPRGSSYIIGTLSGALPWPLGQSGSPRPSAQTLGAVVVTGLKKEGSDFESSHPPLGRGVKGCCIRV